MSVSSTIKKTQITAHDAQCHSWHISSENTPASQRIEATPVGFEPTRGDPIGLAGRRLNHSAKVSFAIEIDLPQNCMHDKLDARRPRDQRIARAGARPPPARRGHPPLPARFRCSCATAPRRRQERVAIRVVLPRARCFVSNLPMVIATPTIITIRCFLFQTSVGTTVGQTN